MYNRTVPNSNSFSALIPLIKRQKWYLAYKKFDVGLLVLMIWLKLTTTSVILSSNKIQNGHISGAGLSRLSCKMSVMSCRHSVISTQWMNEHIAFHSHYHTVDEWTRSISQSLAHSGWMNTITHSISVVSTQWMNEHVAFQSLAHSGWMNT